MLRRSSTLRSGLLAGATILVWKAWLTGMRMARKPFFSKRLDGLLDRLAGAADHAWL
jgi:hypothetical protein